MSNDLRRVANAAVALLSLDLVGVGEAALRAHRRPHRRCVTSSAGRSRSFQAAQHLVANMHIALAAARLAAACGGVLARPTATRPPAKPPSPACTPPAAAKLAHPRRPPAARRHGLRRRHRPAPVVRTGAGALDPGRRRRRGRDLAAGEMGLSGETGRTWVTQDSLIDAESAARVGTVAASATGEVNRREWQRWAAAVGDHNPLWFDADYARRLRLPRRDLSAAVPAVRGARRDALWPTCGPTGPPERSPAASRSRAHRGGWRAARAPPSICPPITATRSRWSARSSRSRRSRAGQGDSCW